MCCGGLLEDMMLVSSFLMHSILVHCPDFSSPLVQFLPKKISAVQRGGLGILHDHPPKINYS